MVMYQRILKELNHEEQIFFQHVISDVYYRVLDEDGLWVTRCVQCGRVDSLGHALDCFRPTQQKLDLRDPEQVVSWIKEYYAVVRNMSDDE
jgi:uncharacterized OB-fold protein